MSAELQTILVLAIVAIAVSYLVRMAWRSLRQRGKAGCGGGCACPGPKAAEGPRLISSDELTLRRPSPRRNGPVL